MVPQEDMSDCNQVIKGGNLVLIGEKVQIRDITMDDAVELYELIYGTENPEWKQWDAPYFPLEQIQYEIFLQNLTNRVIDPNRPQGRMIIEAHSTIIGTVNYYWEHEPSNWLEVGIVIYESQYWNGGYGTESLRLWIDYLFRELPLVRVGLTTWSGNQRMMRVAEKLGMTLEGRMRKCRLYKGVYYDSIRMGVLREELQSEIGLLSGRGTS